MPKVSVFIPCYNDEQFIDQSIRSVLNQTFEDWELIILDDASDDRTFQKAEKYAVNERIQVYRNEQNLGMLNNWNKGIDLCASKYFVKLDADDYWHPEMLERTVPVLDNHPEVGIVFTKYIEVDKNSLPIAHYEQVLPVFAINQSFDCRQLVNSGSDFMLSYEILRQGLSVMRREIFDHIGKYQFLLSKSTQASTDTEFYFRLGCHYKIYQLSEILYFYRKHSNSISYGDTEQNKQPLKIFELKSSIFQYYLNEGVIKQSFYLKEIRKIRFNYYSYLFSDYRKSGRILNSFKYLILNFRLQPLRTIMENLHFKQLLRNIGRSIFC